MRSGPPSIDVAVGIVRNEAGEVLMAERRPGQMAAGFWELPGGKIDPGERPDHAAAREVMEEVGLTAGAVIPAARYAHHFPLRTLNLHFFHIAPWSGTPSGREGQRWAWVNPAAPAVGPVLASNLRILRRLALPPAIVHLPAGTAPDPALLAAARARGHTLFLLPKLALPPAQRTAAARRARALLHGAALLLTGTELEARQAGAAGLISAAADLARMPARPDLPYWGVACHTEADLAAAAAHGADFALVPAALASAAPLPLALYTTAAPHGAKRLIPLEEAAHGPAPAPTLRRSA